MAGEQVVVFARANSGAVCSFGLRTDDGQTTLAQSTFADSTGRLFWLVTIPAATEPGTATVSVRCGSSPDSAPIDIVSAS
jgi:hypothetical protein